MKRAYLVLENGRVFEGVRFGADADCIGELVFTTGVTGFPETLTDPSYSGQIVVQTFPLVGSCGVIYEDLEGACAVSGYVVREWCDAPSNFRCEKSIDEYLKECGVPGICGIDTRELTRVIRNEGTMNAKICAAPPDDLFEVCGYVVEAAPLCERKTHAAEREALFKVAMIDYGAKRSEVKSLCKRGCEVIAFPADVTADEVLAAGVDGLVLSDGPGDPDRFAHAAEQLKKLAGKLPILGVGLGHQLMARAMGGSTKRLKFGHRGANQPVRSTVTGAVHITAQNHGYYADAASLEGIADAVFVNVNDGTCEGLSYKNADCVTVQFFPEPGAVPCGTSYLYDDFISAMGGKAYAKR